MKKLVVLVVGLMVSVSVFAEGFDGYNAKNDNRLKSIYDNIVNELSYLSSPEYAEADRAYWDNYKKQEAERDMQRAKRDAETDELFAKIDRQREADRKKQEEELARLDELFRR